MFAGSLWLMFVLLILQKIFVFDNGSQPFILNIEDTVINFEKVHRKKFSSRHSKIKFHAKFYKFANNFENILDLLAYRLRITGL